MLTAEALVQTEHPARYLIQLGQHVSKMGGHRPRRRDGLTVNWQASETPAISAAATDSAPAEMPGS